MAKSKSKAKSKASGKNKAIPKSAWAAPGESRAFVNGEYSFPVRLGAVNGNKSTATVRMTVSRSNFPTLSEEERFIAAEHEAVFLPEEKLWDEGPRKLSLRFTTMSVAKKQKTLSFSAACNEKSNDLVRLFEARNADGDLVGRAVAAVDTKRGRPRKDDGAEDLEGQVLLEDQE